MIKITVKGTTAVLADLANKRRGTSRILETAVRVSGLQTERAAKINCPAKTGNLRRSIMSKNYRQGNKYIARVGPDVNVAPYAIWVEQGHAQTPGRYVPAIQKRLVASWVEGSWFMAKTGIQMRRKIENNLKLAFQRGIR